MKRLALIAGIAALLAGCGARGPLEPLPGQSLPPVPALARAPLTTEELLTPPPIARPERVDELLRRNEEREDDRFDLPPADVEPGNVTRGDVATGAVPPPDPDAPRDPDTSEPDRPE